MEIKNEYCRNKVVVLKIGQDDVDGMLLNHDLNDDGTYSYMENDLVNLVVNYLPEYAMGYNVNSLPLIELVPHLRQAAKSVIKLKKVEEIKQNLESNLPADQWDDELLKIYRSKGIFSELILHFLLREFKNTTPLISKIYFRDSNAIEAHGFDAVHVTDDKKLWLGETKFYDDGKAGLKALIDDLNKHFNHDYLKEQFVIISRALVHDNPLREEWIAKLNNATRLEEKFDMIVIPLLCIYEDDIAGKILDALNSGADADAIYFDHVSKMKEYFDSKNTFKNNARVQNLLILLPVESKDRIVQSILSKVYYMQNI